MCRGTLRWLARAWRGVMVVQQDGGRCAATGDQDYCSRDEGDDKPAARAPRGAIIVASTCRCRVRPAGTVLAGAVLASTVLAAAVATVRQGLFDGGDPGGAERGAPVRRRGPVGRCPVGRCSVGRCSVRRCSVGRCPVRRCPVGRSGRGRGWPCGRCRCPGFERSPRLSGWGQAFSGRPGLGRVRATSGSRRCRDQRRYVGWYQRRDLGC